MSGSRVTGVEQAIARLHKKIKDLEEVTTSALVRVGLLIQRDAMLLVPVDTGALRISAFTVWKQGGGATGTVGPHLARNPKEEARLSALAADSVVYMGNLVNAADSAVRPLVFVGFGMSYAIFVHENEMAAHVVGEAKYLQTAIENHRDSLPQILQDEARGVI